MLSPRMLSRLVRNVRIPSTPLSRSIATKSMPRPIPRVVSLRPQIVARFSSSAKKAEKEAIDAELAQKLASEIQLEKDIVEFQVMPETVKSFLDTSGFKVIDTPGQEEVQLVKTSGDETIRVEFSISDLNMMNHEHLDEGNAMFDEEADEPEIPVESAQSGGSQSKSAKESNRVEVANDAEEDIDEDYVDDEGGPAFPSNIHVTIEKKGAGSLDIAALAQDGMIILQNVIYHKDSELLKSKNAEANFQLEAVYSGPTFQHLDEDLQVLFEKYLDERGINTALSLFVPDYIEYKEQREYLRWLENIKNFVEA